MLSYAITGASRGLGLEFAIALLDAGNIVIAIVRKKKSVSKVLTNIVDSQKYPNLHVLEADVGDQSSLARAANDTAVITGGVLDVLINNAAYQELEDKFIGFLNFANDDDLVKNMNKSFVTNVLGPIHTTNAFLPLLRKGATKKVMTLCSILGVCEVTLLTNFAGYAAYSVTKSMLDMVNAKYAVGLKDEGFTVLGISPGVVWTYDLQPTPEIRALVEESAAPYKMLYPNWKGPFELTAAKSVEMMLQVLDNAGPEDSGKVLSHFGNKRWL